MRLRPLSDQLDISRATDTENDIQRERATYVHTEKE